MAVKNKIIQGDALTILKTLPSESVDCCITSPPYWGLRDYGTAKWEDGDTNCAHNPQQPDGGQRKNKILPLGRGGVYKVQCSKCGAKRIDNQIGLEPTPEEYVAKLVEIFREVRRVLKKEGTCWLNLGDSYNGSGGAGGDYAKSGLREGQPTYKGRTILTLKPKDLVGIPWRVAFALQADGWYLRQDIIWHKPNPMPESVSDRCTKAHEYMFLLAKSQHYYYDNEAIKEEGSGRIPNNKNPQKMDESRNDFGFSGIYLAQQKPQVSHNRRSVWTITTKPFSEAHFAVFPEELIEPMVKAGTSEKGVCPDCGKAWERIVERKPSTGRKCPKTLGAHKARGGTSIPIGIVGKTMVERGYVRTLGWRATCTCGKEPVKAIVLDLFMGSGTTAVVAKSLGRDYLGIELNPEYIKIAERSIVSQREPSLMKTLKDVQEGKQKTLGML